MDVLIRLRTELLELCHNGSSLRAETFPLLGQGEVVADVAKEFTAKLFFEGSDAHPEGLTAQIQPLGGTGEVQIFADGEKILQLLYRHGILSKRKFYLSPIRRL